MDASVIDKDGFRSNVGIILANGKGQVFWARRIGQDGWQFPQGGLHRGEAPEQALFRELQEEIGLLPVQVKIIASTRGWLRYRLPNRMIRRNNNKQKRVCIGQKQKWYLLQMLDDDNTINLAAMNEPEFDDWRWVSYWYPLDQIIPFKRDVYRRALKELSPKHCELTTDVLSVVD